MSRRDDRSAPVRPGHNRASLDALVDYVEAQCREHCDRVLAEARDEAASVRRQARDHAAQLLREARAQERRTAAKRLETERARQRSRLRERLLADRRAAAEKAVPMFVEALERLWHEDAGVRAAWLERVLADARGVLLGERWTVLHPSGWDEAEGSEVLARYRDGEKEWNGEDASNDADGPGTGTRPAEVDSDAAAGIDAGFRISAGRVVVDATPAGLAARGDWIAGLLLARLPEEAPEIDA